MLKYQDFYMKMSQNSDIQRKYVFLSGFNYFFMIFSSRIIQQDHLSMPHAYIVMVCFWAIFHFEALFSF